jgi:hypothetical protein
VKDNFDGGGPMSFSEKALLAATILALVAIVILTRLA